MLILTRLFDANVTKTWILSTDLASNDDFDHFKGIARPSTCPRKRQSKGSHRIEGVSYSTRSPRIRVANVYNQHKCYVYGFPLFHKQQTTTNEVT